MGFEEVALRRSGRGDYSSFCRVLKRGFFREDEENWLETLMLSYVCSRFLRSGEGRGGIRASF